MAHLPPAQHFPLAQAQFSHLQSGQAHLPSAHWHLPSGQQQEAAAHLPPAQHFPLAQAQFSHLQFGQAHLPSAHWHLPSGQQQEATAQAFLAPSSAYADTAGSSRPNEKTIRATERATKFIILLFMRNLLV